MARIRDTYIEDQLALANAGVRIVPINIVDPISELLIGVRAQNHGFCEDQYAHDVFTKVELVDGSDVLMSMDFKQLQAMHFYNRGVVPHMGISEWDNTWQRAYQNLIFGRDLMDFDYAFDPTRFRNPQLRITWDLAELHAVGDGYFRDDSAKLTVIARCIEQAPRRPGAFFMTKEIYDWETAASGDEPVVMPTDFTYRMLMVRTYEEKINVVDAITDLKMSCDQDAYVPFQYHGWDLMSLMEEWFGKPRTHGKYITCNADYKQNFIGHNVLALMAGRAGHGDYGVQDVDAGHTIISQTNDTQPSFLSALGSGYHHTYCVPFGSPKQPDEWFDPKVHKSIRLLVTQGNAGGAASVVLQQVRPY